MNNIQTLKDNELLKQFDLLVKQEKESIATLVLHLAEINNRKLYAKEGYSSLFNYCVEKYHFSESAACRRIQAAKLSNTFPEIIELLKEGKLNLEIIGLISNYLTKENKEDLLAKVFHKSTREVANIISYMFGKEKTTKDKIRLLPKVKQPEIAQVYTTGAGGKSEEKEESQEEREENKKRSSKIFFYFPPPSTETHESVEEVKEEPKVEEIRRVKIEFTVDEKLAKKIERAQQLLRHKYPQGRFEDIFDEALELLLRKKDPLHRHSESKRGISSNEKQRSLAPKALGMTDQETKKIKTESKSTPQTASRYIPQSIRRDVWKRDNGKCTFQSKDGKQCNESSMLELDHVRPFSLWGTSTSENLRLLCRTHNAYRSSYF